MSLAHSPSIVRNGLVLHLDAANIKSYPKSGTTWTNLIGSVNNGTLTNPLFSNNNNGSIQFFGTDTYVSVVGYKGITGTAARTVNLWFKSTTVNTPQRLISWGFNGFPTSNFGTKYTIRATDNSPWSLRFEFAGGQIYGTGTSTTIVDGNWHMLTVVNPANSYMNQTSLYIDGVQLTNVATDNTSTFSSVLINTSATTDLSIGASIADEVVNGTGPDQRAQGYISIVSIYDRDLTNNEVRQNFEAHRDRYGI